MPKLQKVGYNPFEEEEEEKSTTPLEAEEPKIETPTLQSIDYEPVFEGGRDVGEVVKSVVKAPLRGVSDIAQMLKGTVESKTTKDIEERAERVATIGEKDLSPIERAEFQEGYLLPFRQINDRAPSPTEKKQILKDFFNQRRTDYIKAMDDVIDVLPEEHVKQFSGGVAGFAEDVVTTLPRAAASMAVTAFNPPAGFAVIYSQIAGAAYKKHKDNGIPSEVAYDAAKLEGILSAPLETAGNIFGLKMVKGAVGSVIAKSGLGKKASSLLRHVLLAGAGGAVEEYSQAHPEALAELYASNPDMSAKDMASKFIEKVQSAEFQKSAIYQAAVGGAVEAIIPGVIATGRAPKAIADDLQTKNIKKAQEKAIGKPALEELEANPLIDIQDQVNEIASADAPVRQPDSEVDLFDEFVEETDPEIAASKETSVQIIQPDVLSSGGSPQTTWSAAQNTNLRNQVEEKAAEVKAQNQNAELAQLKVNQYEQQVAQKKEADLRALWQREAAQLAIEQQKQEQQQFVSNIASKEGLLRTTSQKLRTVERDTDPIVKTVAKPMRKAHRAIATNIDSLGTLKDIQYELMDLEQSGDLDTVDQETQTLHTGLSNQINNQIQQVEEIRQQEELTKQLPTEEVEALVRGLEQPVQPVERIQQPILPEQDLRALEEGLQPVDYEPDFIGEEVTKIGPSKPVLAPSRVEKQKPIVEPTPTKEVAEKRPEIKKPKYRRIEETVFDMLRKPEATIDEVQAEKVDVKRQVIKGVKEGKFKGAVKFVSTDNLAKILKDRKVPVTPKTKTIGATNILSSDDIDFVITGSNKKHSIGIVFPQQSIMGKPAAGVKKVTIDPKISIKDIKFIIPGEGRALSHNELIQTLKRDAELAQEASEEEQIEESPFIESSYKVWHKQVDKHVEDISSKIYNKPIIKTVRDYTDLPTKLRREARSAGATRALGQYDPMSGTIYLLSDNIDNIEDISGVLWHELGHYSLEDLFGNKAKPILNQFSVKHRKEVLDWLKSFDAAVTKENINLAAEELLMDHFVANKKTTFVQKLKDLFRKLITRLGFAKGKMTNSDIRNLVKKMRKNLQSKRKKDIRKAKFRKKAIKKEKPSLKKPKFAQKISAKQIVTKPLHETAEDIDEQIGFQEHSKTEVEEGKPEKQSWHSIWQRFITNMADSLNPIRQLEIGQEVEGGKSAYKSFNMLSNFPIILRSMLYDGRIKFENNWVAVTPEKEGGLYTVYSKLGDSADQFFLRQTAKSAAELRKKGRGNLFGVHSETGKQINDKAAIEQLMAKTEDSYQANKEDWDWAEKRLKEINDSVLDFAVKSNFINKEALENWKRDNYIPFYRLVDDIDTGDVDTLFPKDKTPFIGKIHKLSGSTKRMGDPLINLVNSYGFLMNQSLKNLARVKSLKLAKQAGLITRLPAQPKDKRGVTSIRINGKEQFYRVNDPLLYDAIMDVDGATNGNFIKAISNMKIFTKPKQWLTTGVTVAPAFRVANFLRDTVHTSFMEKSFVPFIDSYRGIMEAARNSDQYKEFLSTGGAFSGAYHKRDVVSNSQVEIQDLKKRLKKGEQPAWKRMSPFKFWSKLGDVTENAARMGVYLKRIKKGDTKFEAAYAAKDLLDFHRSGKSQTLQFFIRTVPFLNARIQGLYKLGRTAANPETRMKFALMATMMITMSTILQLYNDEEEWYQDLPDHEKIAYWHIGIPAADMRIRIPKPFEVGTFFAAYPEALIETIKGQRTKSDLGKFAWHTMNETFKVDAPQTVKVIAQQWANKDAFTKAPIVPAGEEKIDPELQYGPRTSTAAKLLGKAIGATGVPDAFASPRRIDKFAQDLISYNAYIGSHMADLLLDNIVDYPADPAITVGDRYLSGIGRFLKPTNVPARYIKAQQQFYELMLEADKSANSYRAYVAMGDKESAKEYRKKKREYIISSKKLKPYQQKINKINNRIRRIYEDKELTSEQKRTQIDKQLIKRNNIFKKAVERFGNK